MTRQDRLQLIAELSFLQERLGELPEAARITRMSTLSRIRAIEEQLAQEPANLSEPAIVRITFNGRPVIGSHGIFAEFGMKAVTHFSDTVAAVAASMSAPLAATGPIPDREQHQLLITSIAQGSFGFELEEYRDEPNDQLPEGASPMALALERTQNLLQSTVGTDDQLADSAAETDPRALARLRAFLQTLADNEAVCTIQYQDRGFRFTDVGQVRNSLARLSRDNLHEDERTLDGEFQGVLPKGRTFEFRLTPEDEVIRGKIGPAIPDPDALNARLHQPARIKVMLTRVGDGRPRFTLLETPEWVDPPVPTPG
ncbi:MAG: hypothetical protein CVU65_18835 [Deltaproteobacteria bacterium HGW-Deltaproteobacteria-22]|nr:MAG: hypothetical protein CVU65_18835 [Deltaproteobacteria bacterium HGW-Deltaproteobacteria-22]